ncbi:translocation/assembly module TamB domain-containing protein [Blochmannia endosymbiont of Camponotus sp.]|uniref:autotransporter assembly complex protein TamB n=1 Tax=Blochmannia endosymbiont of Camponotus sp. TaxID=700220 RepID=UPI002025131D|nr:translocation/assembly module TamB domain-containing protein [Blochmannia endosymbiont of Camponotus sp.]URJ29709.1 translocation/assembly module TamB domain-containing protein [Blochmannia endosymbiont of Camponotus sp.]
MIFIKKIYLIFLLWIATICGVFMFLLGTNTGTYLTLTGISYYIPGLTFDSVSGTWGNFNITHIVYKTSIGIIDIDQCNILLNLKYIWNKQIYIDHLFLKNVFIKIKKADTDNQENERYKKIKIENIFSFPFPIILKKMVLNNIHIISNNIIFKLKTLDTGLTFQDNLLTVLPVCIKGAVLNVSNVNMSNIKTNIINIYKYSSQLDVKCLLKSLSSKLLMELSSFKIPVNLILKDVEGENVYIFDNYRNYYTINHFYFRTYLHDQAANLKLNVKLPYGYFNAIGNVIFKEYYPINITANYIVCDASSANNSSDKIKNQNINKIKLILTGELYNDICLRCDFLGVVSTVHVLLKINMMQFGIPIGISIVGRKIPLSFLGIDDYLIEDINLCLNGKIQSYCIQITLQLSSIKFSAAHIIMNARGNANSCTISKLKATMSDGYFNMQGVINWTNMISWNSVFLLNKVSFFQKWFKNPIKLSGNIVTQGRLHSNAWDIRVSDLNLKGSIADSNISCTGAFYSNSFGEWKIPALLIKWGPNSLEIQGDLKKDSVLNATLAAPDCNVVALGLSGSVYGKFKLYGPIKYLRLLSNIDIFSLNWREKNLNINKIMIKSDIYRDDMMQSKFFLQTDKMRCGFLSLRQIIMQGQGNIKQHYLHLTACDDKLSGEIKFCGNLDFFNKTWYSRINKTSIMTTIGTWKLMQDIVLTYQHSTQKIIFDSHYWEIINYTIPISNVLKTNILNKIDGLLKSFNVVSLKILLPELINIHTVRIYLSNCYWIIGERLPKGTILFSGKQCNIKSSIEDIEINSIKINKVTVRIVLMPVTSYCTWFINFGNYDQNYGSFKITELHNTSKITGNIQIKNTSLFPFCRSLISLRESIDGLLNLNINFYGFARHLKIYGSAQLQNFNINKPDTPFFVKNGQLFIRFFGDYATVNGTMNTDNGSKLNLNGDIANFNFIRNIRAFFRIWGNQINFCISPKIKMKISPNITCMMTTEKIHLRGNIEIPWAHIEVKEPSRNIVRASAEEILLDNNFEPILDKSKNLCISIYSNITVSLGNDVNFNGLGLCTKLKGNLEIGCNRNNLLLTGRIDMLSGYFQAYGQNLMIKKGHLLFSGSINQPYLDIEAICNSSNISNRNIVGIRITGIFDQPKLEVFSTSSLFPPQEIVSYLLGDNRNFILFNTDASIITSFLIGASVKNSEQFFNKIGKIFGVQDLALNTQDIIGTTPLVAISGYIAPGLQIKYGISIFDLLTTITVRYCLCSQLYLEAASGSNQALDLLYKFDF